jgi:hypothetical protein
MLPYLFVCVKQHARHKCNMEIGVYINRPPPICIISSHVKFNAIRFKYVKFLKNSTQYALTKLTFEKMQRYTLEQS